LISLLGIVFGTIGLFSLGLLFIGLGFLCTVFGFIKGQIFIGIISLMTNIFALIVAQSTS